MDVDDVFKKIFKRDKQDKSKDGEANEDVEQFKLHIDLLQKQLAKAKQQNNALVNALEGARHLEGERDKYRATVISLAYQNKLLSDDVQKSRRGVSGKEERYVDAQLQIADLKEALLLKEKEIEELQAARDYMPTSDSELFQSYSRMRDVFESLKSTLSCSLCYEPYSANDVVTLECGHTMCQQCLRQWSDSRHRLYNLTTTPDCPECRMPGRHYVKVYLLEEIVRTVRRLDKLEEAEEERKREIRKASLPAREARVAEDIEVEQAVEDTQVASLLLERSRQQYVGSIPPPDIPS